MQSLGNRLDKEIHLLRAFPIFILYFQYDRKLAIKWQADIWRPYALGLVSVADTNQC